MVVGFSSCPVRSGGPLPSADWARASRCSSFAQRWRPRRAIHEPTCIPRCSTGFLANGGAYKSSICRSSSTYFTSSVVDSLMHLTKDIDGGPQTSPQRRDSIDSLIGVLSEVGEDEDYLSDPKLFDSYRVAYTSSKNRKNGPPAGGRFTGRIGRILFRSRGLFQHLLQPNQVVNLVAFNLFGFIPGAVGLLGTLYALPRDELGPNGIKVVFERPRIALLGFVLLFGSQSSVRIRTAFLDERVRIGIGGQGSLFVFTKGEDARTAVSEEWKMLFSESVKKPLPMGTLVLFIVAAVAVFRLLPWFVGVALLALFGWRLSLARIRKSALQTA